MKTSTTLRRSSANSEDAIVVPAILWWMGVPLSVVLILWLVF